MPRLAIDIEAQLASFEAGIRKVDGTVSGLAGRLNGAFGGVSTALQGIATAVAGGSIAALVRNFADAGDQLNKLSQKTGVAVESLSELQYAARLSDVSTEQLGDGFRKLAVNMTEAARGTGEAKDAFKALGISQRELQSLSPDAAFRRIADAFANIEDGAGKSALAVKIFGRSGTELIPLLNSGAAGLSKMGEEARRFGLVISAETAQAAEAFNDNITRLQASVQGLGFALANEVLPSLDDFLKELLEGTRIFGSFGSALLNIGLRIDPFKDLNENLRETRANIVEIQAKLDGIPASGSRLRNSLSQDLDTQKRLLEFLEVQQRARIQTGNPSTFDARDRQLQQAVTQRRAAPTLPGEKTANPYAAGTERGGRFLANIYLQQFQELEKQARAIQDDLRTQFDAGIKADEQVAERFRTTLEGLLGDTTSGKTAGITADLDVLNTALIQGTITAEQYDEAFANIQSRFDDLNGVPSDFAKELDTNAEAFAQLEAAIKGWGNAFNEELVQGLRKGQLDVSKIVDTILTDIARLTLYRAITQPLFGAISNFGAYAFGGAGGQQNASYYQFGKRAFGGPVSAGMPYLVGERGPELVVPRNDATVVPNGAWGGVQFSQQIVINAPTDAAVIRAAVAQGAVVARSEIARAARVGAMS